MSALAAADSLTLYEQLAALPDGLTGELLAGQLHTQPRPTGPHGRAAVRLDRTIGRGYDDGEDGPGGWWILVEPEVHFVRDQVVAVPDLAGWRRERMPHYGVAHVWLVDPLEHSLEVYALEAGAWRAVLQASGVERVQAPPFIELTLELESLWV
ncbi:Putative restriction endonuclease [Allochromatium warmingii]|uniref:Putative restriction endonuclease n=1 Tax=Allochromatium warmingii TaxID=61595 RepID=A0A1H3GTQ9_ALLWA|nr:Uma2 family endonuclease [Allochromatium warmingii]SDY05729.1 Putative restriction endonuclease [Allochromatium warmingii]